MRGKRNSLAWPITAGEILKCRTMSLSSLIVPELVFVLVGWFGWLVGGFPNPAASPPLSQEAEDSFFYREGETEHHPEQKKPLLSVEFQTGLLI